MVTKLGKQLGIMLANGDTICLYCIRPDEHKSEVAIYQEEYEVGREPICDRCQATMMGD